MNRNAAFSWQMIGWSLLSAATAIGVSLLDRANLVPGSVRPIVALAPVVPLVAFFLGIVRWIRQLDELQRMIHLEALVFQLTAVGIPVMSYGMLAKAQVVPDVPVTRAFPILWIALFAFWSLGIVVVRRKYQ